MTEHEGDVKVYNLAQAAAAAGVSLPTIRRRKDALVAAGAVVDPKGWRIPHTALVAVGFKPDWTTADVDGDEGPQEPLRSVPELEAVPTDAEELQAAKDRISRLESEQRILRHQVESAQAIARERLDALNDLRVAFRALVMSRPQPQLEAVPHEPEPAPAPTEEPKRGWWDRLIHG